MLKDLKEISPIKPSSVRDIPHYDEYIEEIQELGKDLDNYQNREKKFEYKKDKVTYNVVIRGIPEDFKIFLNDNLVCECVYRELFNVNLVLFRLLVL